MQSPSSLQREHSERRFDSVLKLQMSLSKPRRDRLPAAGSKQTLIVRCWGMSQTKRLPNGFVYGVTKTGANPPPGVLMFVVWPR